MSESGLKLVVAHLLVAGVAFRAIATTPDKRDRDAVSDFPVFDFAPKRRNNAGQFMAWHMG